MTSNNQISFVDVKELYDAAYDEKAKAHVNMARYSALLAEAEGLAESYLHQLATTPAFSYRRAVA